MLTSFRSTNQPKVKKEEKLEPTGKLNRWEFFLKAVQCILAENSYRIEIDEDPYIVDIKLPKGLELHQITQQKCLSSASKVVNTDNLVDTFLLQGMNEPLEVWYKPFSRPRL